MAVFGEGAVPLGAESCHSAREFLDASQKLVVCWLANARERERGNGLDVAVSAVGREVQLDLWMAGKSGLHVCGKPAGPDGSQEVVRQVRDEASEVIRNCDGLRSPISSSVRIQQARCSLERPSRFRSSVLSLEYGSCC
jgi:hypothetical protein